MNIIHVIPKAKLGGVETAVFSSFHEILNHGYCFRIVSIESDDATYSKGNIDITSLNSSFFSPLGFLRFLKFMKDNKPDLVVFSLWKSALFGLVWQLFSNKRNKVKTAFIIHNTKFYHILDKIITKIAVKNFDAIYFDSHETKQVFEKQENIKGEVLSFITSKITPKQFSLDIRNINMVYIGRIHKSKNLKDSIRFVKKLNELGVCANFDMYGPDEGELADITSAIESFGLSSKIKYKGVLKYNEVDDVLKNYDVYLQLSLYEGMAMSVVTALQAGLIALVSAVGEIPNYIEDGVNGVLFDISCLDDDIYIEKIASDFQRLINENKLIKMHEIGKVTFANKPLYAEDYINKIIKHT